MADTATQNTPTKGGVQKNVKSKVSDAKNQAGDTKRDAQDAAQDAGTNDGTQYDEQTDSGVDGLQTSNDEGGKDDDEDEASEVLPAGSVDHNGDVVSEAGKVIGHVDGEDASQFEGSMVDQEGDVLDKEGNILGHAELREGHTDVDADTVKQSAKSQVEGEDK